MSIYETYSHEHNKHLTNIYTHKIFFLKMALLSIYLKISSEATSDGRIYPILSLQTFSCSSKDHF